MTRRTLVGLIATATLLGGCDDGNPYLGAAFRLLDRVAPESYRQVGESSDRSSAIRWYAVGGSADPAELELPERFERKNGSDTGSYGRTRDLGGLWVGPSPADGAGTCALFFVTKRDDPQIVELTATCALAD